MSLRPGLAVTPSHQQVFSKDFPDGNRVSIVSMVVPSPCTVTILPLDTVTVMRFAFMTAMGANYPLSHSLAAGRLSQGKVPSSVQFPPDTLKVLRTGKLPVTKTRLVMPSVLTIPGASYHPGPNEVRQEPVDILEMFEYVDSGTMATVRDGKHGRTAWVLEKKDHLLKITHSQDDRWYHFTKVAVATLFGTTESWPFPSCQEIDFFKGSELIEL